MGVEKKRQEPLVPSGIRTRDAQMTKFPGIRRVFFPRIHARAGQKRVSLFFRSPPSNTVPRGHRESDDCATRMTERKIVLKYSYEFFFLSL